MMKGQKGITLVALIITIIVMLILVGVSISVALNGGLFTKAGTAARQTKQAQVSEAVALAKAELLEAYYSAKTDADRKAPDVTKVENTIHAIGLILLMGLMLFVSFNDVLRCIGCR